MAKKTLTQATYATNNIQSQPVRVVGQASALQLAFDQGIIDQKTYNNLTLLVELQAETLNTSGSFAIGHGSANVTANNVGDAIEALAIAVQGDGSMYNMYPVLSYNLKGDGVTDDAPALNTLITTIGSDNATIVFPALATGDAVYLLNGDVTIPKNITVIINNGATIKVGNTYTLTSNNAKLEAGIYKIFDLSLGGVLAGTFNAPTSYPQWMGVINDGTTDGTTAWQTFFDTTALGTHATVVEGNYLTSDQLTLNRELTIKYKENAVHLLAVGFLGKSLYNVTSDNVIIDGIEFDGTNLPLETVEYDGTFDPKGVGVFMKGGAGVELENCKLLNATISNCSFPGAMMLFCKDLIVENCTFDTCSTNETEGSPATLYGVDGIRNIFKYNRVIESGMKGINLSSGEDGVIEGNILIHSNTGQSALFAANEKRVKIIGNTVQGGNGCKIDRGIEFEVSHNVFSECSLGAQAQGATSGIISNNIVNNTTSGEGIIVSGNLNTGVGITNVDVSDNVITIGAAAAGIDAIQLYSATGYGVTHSINVVNNIISGGNIGIHMDSAAGFDYDKITIKGNKVKDTVSYGIFGKGDNIDVSENEVTNTGSDSIRIEEVTSGTTDSMCKVTDNFIDSSGNYSIYFPATSNHKSAMVSDNIIKNSTNHAIIFSATGITNININNNMFHDLVTTRAIQVQGVVSFTQNLNIHHNNAIGKEIIFATTGDMVGYLGGNNATISGKPAGVLLATYA